MQLPQDIWFTIVHFLHDSSMFPFYSTCKSFYSMLNSHDELFFAKRCVVKFPEKNNRQCFFITHYAEPFDKLFFASTSFSDFVKFVLHGPSKAGKSAFMNCFMDKMKIESDIPPTIGVDFVLRIHLV